MRFGTFAAWWVLALPISCGREPAPPTGEVPKVEASEVLATVNGSALTEADLRHRLKSESRQSEIAPEHVPNVLGPLIDQELLAQAARAQGLRLEGPALERYRDKEAELRALLRKELAELYFRHEVSAKATPSDAEVEAYFRTHQSRIQTELHVLQILRKTEAEIEEVRQRLTSGENFAKVAQGQLPDLPEGAPRPWDLGFLNWKQVPEVWWPALEPLADGQVSGVVRGPKDRYWILQVVGRRPHPSAELEVVRPVITELLRAQRIERDGAALEQRLKDRAQIQLLLPSP
ncbi:MAG: peptidyl-prolyl cis-trans isomerase [Deltaproteobacteria bacterium]|jgi:hypothetical protein|nr:peptidyl-prolyl cis-trans isomerase [Deltaproteobacteria bacterium]